MRRLIQHFESQTDEEAIAEDEARDILRTALNHQTPTQKDLATAINSRFASLGGVELDIPPRSPMRQPPRFD